MLAGLHFAARYARYYLHAQNKHDIHSTFFFNLTTQVINKECRADAFDEIEALRERLKHNATPVDFVDYGAGGTLKKNKTLTIASIAKRSAKAPRYARLLYRLVQHFKPAHVLELGTSLGISTLYMAKANPNAQVITLEGSPAVAHIAMDNFKQLQALNIQLIKGAFENTLENVVNNIPQLDFVFFDGNHQQASTLSYFKTCLRKKHAHTVFVFDDINWSPEMKQAWEAIKNHPEVYVTIDLFMMGIVFFNPDFSRQHFTIRF